MAVETFRYRLPAGLAAGAAIDVAVEARDDFGNLVTRTTRATVLADDADPVASLAFSPQAVESTYTAGNVVELIALASDEVAIDRLTLSVDGATVASSLGGAPIDFAYTLPAVAAPTVLTIEAEAFDVAGNVGRATRQLRVLPLQNAGLPTVLFDCLTSGAVLPAGYSLPLSLKATDDLGVARIEVFRNGESAPFATLVPPGGTPTTFTAGTATVLPAPASGYAETTLRAVAYDASGNSSEQSLAVRSVNTIDLKPDGGGTNTWSSLAGADVVLRSGT